MKAPKQTGKSDADLIDFNDLDVKTVKDKSNKKSLDDDAWAMLDG